MTSPTSTALPKVTIGGREFALSILTLGMFKKIGPSFAIIRTMREGELPDGAQIDAMIDVVHGSIRVSEPELTREEFGALVDALPWDVGSQELAAAFSIVAEGSGLNKKKEEASAPGEAKSP